MLKPSFYERSNVVSVARDLLGKTLFTKTGRIVTAGTIVETEAYSRKEKGCHAYQNKMTLRNQVMFKNGGHAYVYLCYGIHHLFNVVTNVEGEADAVLIRALEPVHGVEQMKVRMNTVREARITSGPGKLAKALQIDRSLNGKTVWSKQLWIEEGIRVKPTDIVSSPRVGIDYAGEDALLPWRFSVKGNAWVSK